jgi:Uma2 family endonuclease
MPSIEEYFGIEEMSAVRHEYLGGEIFAMAGGSRAHNQIAQNLTRAFDAIRGRGCRTYLADVRLRTPGGLYTYPDVMVICGSDARRRPARDGDEPGRHRRGALALDP